MFYKMGKRYYGCSIVFLIFIQSLCSQTGGRQIFQFLNLSSGARIAALGGMPIAWRANDPGIAFYNPSTLTKEMSGKIYFAHQFYFADISNGHAAYSYHAAKPDLNFQLGVHYINHGDLNRTDVYGNSLGSFKAKETDFYILASKIIKERLSVGLNLQMIFSNLDGYTSSGLAFNSGVNYFNPEKNYSLTLLFKNAGFQLSKYNNESENLPFEIQLGFAKKLKHLPLIYHISLQHLEKWNVRYDDPDLNDNSNLFGDVTKDKPFEKALGTMLRHVVIGAELNVGKKENFSLRLGYNHLRKSDLSVTDYRSFSGLSAGFGIKIYKFKFDYSYAVYHLAGGTSQITISTNLNSFVKKEL